MAGVLPDAERPQRRRPGRADREIAAIAVRQHGVLCRDQLRALGLSDRAVSRRIEAGRLHVVHRAVYAVGHPLLTQHGRWLAAVLAVGPGAVLSHRSAAALWGLAERPPAPVEVTVFGGSRKRRRGIIVHRTEVLDDRELTQRARIPSTTVERTLLDLAMVVSSTGLRDAFEEAERLQRLNATEVTRLVRRTPTRRGAGRVRSLLAASHLPLSETRSGLERRFLRFCRDRGLPIPAVNVPLEGKVVDCLWSQQRLVAELDSWTHHGARNAFESDRERDVRIQLAGHRLIRITSRRLDRPDRLEADLRQLLALDGGRPSGR